MLILQTRLREEENWAGLLAETQSRDSQESQGGAWAHPDPGGAEGGKNLLQGNKRCEEEEEEREARVGISRNISRWNKLSWGAMGALSLGNAGGAGPSPAAQGQQWRAGSLANPLSATIPNPLKPSAECLGEMREEGEGLLCTFLQPQHNKNPPKNPMGFTYGSSQAELCLGWRLRSLPNALRVPKSLNFYPESFWSGCKTSTSLLLTKEREKRSPSKISTAHPNHGAEAQEVQKLDFGGWGGAEIGFQDVS